ncbi:DUF975 family protein [Nicoliella spurrieriana]|uniref:DUF975 family protein n=1 Tax=Nicoliella spurrieriana TaxID=2925830 RepID=A0A976RTL2_9LACO|nr:DUF975 family protein [Nicoliella spurrieriana]UQS87366.1 DUF975 family protein [Nicoliella spurrieriana]
MNFADLKRDANQELLKNFGFYFILYLPFLILQSLSGLVANHISGQASNALLAGTTDAITNFTGHYNGEINFYYLISFITAIVGAGISFQILSLIRNQTEHTGAFGKSTAIFSTKLIFGVIATILLEYIFIFLWLLLFIVPGVVKSFSYSQAVYIYRDAYVSGNRITPLQAITLSRRLMDGHKGELFLLSLSFIGWWILLSIVTSFTILPVLGIFVYPYYQITMMNYYNRLSA